MLVEVKKAGKEEKIIVTSLDVADTFQRSSDSSILSRPIT